MVCLVGMERAQVRKGRRAKRKAREKVRIGVKINCDKNDWGIGSDTNVEREDIQRDSSLVPPHHMEFMLSCRDKTKQLQQVL